MDCGIHDIDIARWMFNVESSGKKQVQRVFATGMNIRHPELADDGDVDNALGTVEFSNGTICTFHLSRTAMHGHDCFTEIFGSQSKIIVNGVSLLSILRKAVC
jgi:myo-inositol 2-dehydrogenase/D-chiro-inositol 1-dehydrogenase